METFEVKPMLTIFSPALPFVLFLPALVVPLTAVAVGAPQQQEGRASWERRRPCWPENLAAEGEKGSLTEVSPVTSLVQREKRLVEELKTTKMAPRSIYTVSTLLFF